MGPEQRRRLWPYVVNIAVNLWGCGLLQEWNIQINICAAPEIYVSGEDIRIYYKQRSLAIQVVEEHKEIAKPSELLTALPLK